MNRLLRRLLLHKGTAYYVSVLLMLALTIGFGVAALLGVGIAAEPSIAFSLHESPLVVEHGEDGEHEQTWLGDLLFSREAEAHKYPYCGSGTIWPVISGVQHRVKHLYYYANGDNHIRTDHYIWSGTGYVRVDGSREDYRIDC